MPWFVLLENNANERKRKEIIGKKGNILLDVENFIFFKGNKFLF